MPAAPKRGRFAFIAFYDMFFFNLYEQKTASNDLLKLPDTFILKDTQNNQALDTMTAVRQDQ